MCTGKEMGLVSQQGSNIKSPSIVLETIYAEEEKTARQDEDKVKALEIEIPTLHAFNSIEEQKPSYLN